MSNKEWRRLDLMKRIEDGEVTIAQAATALGLSARQVKRLRKRVARDGAAGIIHGNKRRAPAHRTPAAIRDKVIELRRGKYEGFNDQHFTEKLAAFEDIELSRQTVSRILRLAGIGAARHRRPAKHRRRRDRSEQAGRMILWDGSRHDWLEGRGPFLCLMGAIDDATGELLPGAHFVEQEGTVGYLRVLRDIVTSKGVPVLAYMDRHGALKRNDKNWSLEEQLAGRQEPTQVKRALDELNVHVIYALSPQAKGRVERAWGTLQDRLVSELRLAKASTAKEADQVLESYRLEHNRRFAIAAANSETAWRAPPTDLSVEDICALQHVRLVANNNTVRIGNQVIDIPKSRMRGTFAKAEVIVRQHLTGRYRIFHKGLNVAEGLGEPPTEATGTPLTPEAFRRRRRRQLEQKRQREVTESLSG